MCMSNDETEEEVDIEQDVDLSDEDQESNEDVDTEESTDEDIDYKSELERLEGDIALKNQRIAKQDKKILKLKQRGKEEADTDEEEEADLDTLVSRKVEEQMSNFVQDTIEEEIATVSSDEDEQKLIKWYFTNRIVKTGWSKNEIKEYIADAKALANRGKAIANSKIIGKKTASDKSAGSPNFTGTPPKKSNEKITAYDIKQADTFFKGDIKKWMKYKSN